MADPEPETVGGGDVVEAEGWGVRRGMEGYGEGAVPPPQNFFFNFGPQNGQFRCTVGAGGGMHPPHPPPGSATATGY